VTRTPRLCRCGAAHALSELCLARGADHFKDRQFKEITTDRCLFETTKAGLPSFDFMLNSRNFAAVLVCVRICGLRRSGLLSAGLIVWLSSATGQSLRLGGVVGTPFTNGIQRLPDWNEINPAPRGLIGGPMLELGFDSGLALEINAVHRTIGYDYYYRFADGSRSPWIRADIGTWQFPILVKYTLPRGRLRPLIEAGPSFRAVRNKAGTEPSPFGITVGAGAELRFRQLTIAPVLRFTHWGGETWPHRPTVRNQVELLASISYPVARMSPDTAPRRVRFGVVAGAPLTGDFPPPIFSLPFTGSTTRTADFRSVAGLIMEVGLSDRFALEVNGLYRRLHFDNRPEVVVTWQMPVLAKHKFRDARTTPFVQAGPSFRLAGNLNGTNPSHFGATAGAGLEFHLARAKLAPALRYTRWLARDATKSNQVELLVAVSF
jgi:hypothetical protein